MKKSSEILICIFFFTFITINHIENPYLTVQAQTEGNFRLDQIEWQAPRIPGATGVPLQFQIMNLDNKTITSVFGVLSLSFPFTDNDDGDSNASSIGEALSTYFNVSQYVVLAGEPFEFVFNLDIDENAIKGDYSANLTITYYIESGGITPGPTIVFQLDLRIPNTPPEIVWVRPTAGVLVVDPAEKINFSVICSDEDNDTLIYSWEVDNVPLDDLNASSFLFTAQEQVGVQEITLYVSDSNDTITQTWVVETQIQSDTNQSINTQYLLAGTTTELIINLSNNLWRGPVIIQLQDPTPLIIEGDSNWVFNNISEGETITFPVKLFTPTSAMSATGTAIFSISFSDHHGTNYYEIVSIGLIIRGVIQVSIFSSEISEITINQGSMVTISATLLNTGNTNAIFANASILIEEGVLVETSNSKSYLGELEPDSPLPFSVSANINNSAEAGEYQISCIIFYQDDLFSTYRISVNFTINIVSLSETSDDNSRVDLGSLFVGSGVALIIGGGTIIAVILIINRKRKL
ncbi:MAG: COG1361 S-layer family protein [Candidatus Hodarchaeales archaeon]|jgi:hypothetical protein